ncbi:MAG TPA: type I 3-dehydroquinate dehydratase, partial [Gemmataceae bacterium]|nr:type I 3-dehydroquinate dehydratase [Gemmataceae bacterium]
MICIAIAQMSRRLALADMLNASRQCDLIELQLDAFERAPDVRELLQHRPRPMILSCRRQRDGGKWQGSEDERLALLRQCIVSKADYVEIELDVADQVRPFPPAKRVISYTNLAETPDDIADIYAECQKKKPDVIKLVTLARTPEEAWPLVKILANPPVPTVVVGLGKPGVMLTVLGKKIGTPWAYAALERGMEAYPGQPTARDLNEVYHYGSINKHTRLIGVTGFSDREFVTLAAVNAALARLGLPARCLPLTLGSMGVFRKVVAACKLAALLVGAEYQRAVVEMADELAAAAKQAGAADLLMLSKSERWHGYNTLDRAAVAALEAALRERHPGEKPLQGRMVMVVGANGTARAMATLVQECGAAVILASRDKTAAQQLAQELGCRFVQLEALYSTMHDVLIVCDEEKQP